MGGSGSKNDAMGDKGAYSQLLFFQKQRMMLEIGC